MPRQGEVIRVRSRGRAGDRCERLSRANSPGRCSVSYKVKLTATTTSGQVLAATRTYHPCARNGRLSGSVPAREPASEQLGLVGRLTQTVVEVRASR